MSSTLRIAFVCSGNICRSPMATALAPPLLEEAGLSYRIISGGTLGIQGRRAASHARAAIAELDLDLESHRSQGANPALLRHADHIVVMAPRHERKLRASDASLAHKIVRLWEYADEDLDKIPDPVGHDLETFRASRDLIQACLRRWIDTLET
jgi:protein-tyrosine-phosphatase